MGSKSATLAAVSAGTVTVVATDTSIGSAVTGLPVPVRSVAASFNVSDLNASISTLQAQVAGLNNTVASLTAQLNAANAALAAEKAAHASDSATATTALNTEKALHNADVTNDKITLASVNKSYLALIAKYNALAKRFRQPQVTK